MNVDWKLKIKAFLYQLPWGALCEQEPDDRQIIKDFVGNGDLDIARQANEIAFGLDVPPFVRQQQDLWSVWLKEPVLKHPLSGGRCDLEGLPKDKNDICTVAKQAVKEVLGKVKKMITKRRF